MKRSKFLVSFAMAVAFAALAISRCQRAAEFKTRQQRDRAYRSSRRQGRRQRSANSRERKVAFQLRQEKFRRDRGHIEDVVTGEDTQAAVGKTVSTLSMAAPYGSGRFLALFRTKFDTLTLRYRDENGALHGVIFALPTAAPNPLRKNCWLKERIPRW